MGNEPKSTRAFAPENEQLLAWLEKVNDLLMAATDTAEFASGEAIGRSRQASIRRLKKAVEDLEALEAIL
jgi:hypothetical protein